MTILYGEKKFEPIKYKIECKIENVKWLWFWTYPKRQYYLVCDYIKLGPFNSYEEARTLQLMAERI